MFWTRAARGAITRRTTRDSGKSTRGISHKPFNVLGIESSCDDSCVGIVRVGDRNVLADERISQFSVHQAFGGIVPILAVREHEVNLPLVLAKALERTKDNSIDLIAVSIGPGLKACLRTGMKVALQLQSELKVPVIGVNHLEAHALVPRLDCEDIKFPFMTLLVSGGHTCLSIARGPGDHIELGSTLDDAIGEAFDKVIRSLDHPSAGTKHGGAVLEDLARKGNANCGLVLPVPLRGPTHKRGPTLDFSFSGLKSATSRAIASRTFAPEDVAVVFQNAAVFHTTRVVEMALKAHPAIKQLVVSGGVASNEHLRKMLKNVAQSKGVEIFFPSTTLCVDNGVMAAWCGAERWLGAKDSDARKSLEITAETNPRARWPFAELRAVPSVDIVVASNS